MKSLLISILVRALVFFLVALTASIQIAKRLWEHVALSANADAFHNAAKLIGPSFGLPDAHMKDQQIRVIQYFVDAISVPSGIAIGFAALWLTEIYLRRRQKTVTR
jgi:hypothetical protein